MKLLARGNTTISLLVLTLVLLGFPQWHACATSIYTQRLDDPKAIYVAPSGTNDDTETLQHAVNQVQETTGQGIVFMAPGRYHISDTVHIWPGIRVIGYGAQRPVIVLPDKTPGFENASGEKVMIFFAGGRPGFGRGRSRNSIDSGAPVPDANPGTFYSALANIDVEIGEGNSGAVAVRARYAQHC